MHVEVLPNARGEARRQTTIGLPHGRRQRASFRARTVPRSVNHEVETRDRGKVEFGIERVLKLDRVARSKMGRIISRAIGRLELWHVLHKATGRR